MGYYARLDEDNKVINVVSFGETDDELLANQMLQKIHGPSVWKRTSYNDRIRKNYAGIGYSYDENLDAFIPPRPPFESWTLDPDLCIWVPPVPYPQDGGMYDWEESSQSWTPR